MKRRRPCPFPQNKQDQLALPFLLVCQHEGLQIRGSVRVLPCSQGRSPCGGVANLGTRGSNPAELSVTQTEHTDSTRGSLRVMGRASPTPCYLHVSLFLDLGAQTHTRGLT